MGLFITSLENSLAQRELFFYGTFQKRLRKLIRILMSASDLNVRYAVCISWVGMRDSSKASDFELDADFHDLLGWDFEKRGGVLSVAGHEGEERG